MMLVMQQRKNKVVEILWIRERERGRRRKAVEDDRGHMSVREEQGLGYYQVVPNATSLKPTLSCHMRSFFYLVLRVKLCTISGRVFFFHTW